METKTSSNGNAVLVAIFAAAVLVVFTAFRSTDLLKLPQLVGNLGGGPLFGDLVPIIVGLIAALFILQAWVGLGKQIFRLLDPHPEGERSMFFAIAKCAALGAAVWSLVWFFSGFFGGYHSYVAIILVVLGNVLLIVPGKVGDIDSEADLRWLKGITLGEWTIMVLGALSVLLAFIASLAPPIAKDTLLYHLAVPKAFIAQGGNALIEGNIASYLALGTEMHSVWAMLLGGLHSAGAGETAAGATVFLFFPLLLLAVYGWARQAGVSRIWSLVATLMVATIPTAFHVASSGYIDLSLALYVTLAVYALTRWWKTLTTAPLIMAGAFLGAALSVKLTAVFVIAAIALVILLRARNAENAGRVVVGGFAALLLAGVLASPW
ncbi:MAG: hypothetical protein WBO10_12855, partial [Pyrinomonadaceae bacterium]